MFGLPFKMIQPFNRVTTHGSSDRRTADNNDGDTFELSEVMYVVFLMLKHINL